MIISAFFTKYKYEINNLSKPELEILPNFLNYACKKIDHLHFTNEEYRLGPYAYFYLHHMIKYRSCNLKQLTIKVSEITEKYFYLLNEALYINSSITKLSLIMPNRKSPYRKNVRSYIISKIQIDENSLDIFFDSIKHNKLISELNFTLEGMNEIECGIIGNYMKGNKNLFKIISSRQLY